MGNDIEDRKKLVRVRLAERDLTQAQLATRAGVSPATLSRIIARQYPTRTSRSRSTLTRVLGVVSHELDIPLDDLAEGDPAAGYYRTASNGFGAGQIDGSATKQVAWHGGPRARRAHR